MQTILTLETILSHGVSLIEENSKHRTFVNEFNVTMTKEIVDFLYLHYFSTRSDTDFWRSFDYGAKEMPERVLNTVELAKERALSEADYNGNRLIFTSTNYQAIIVGNGLLSIEDMRRHYTNQRVDRMEEYLSLRRNVGLTTLHATNHNLFLNRMLIKT
jgi:hypothetical protein